MFVVDTNILVYAVNQASPDHTRCSALLENWRAQTSAWFLTWNICYEFLRVTTHPGIFPSPLSAAQAWSFLDALLASPGVGVLEPTERHRTVVAEVLQELPHLAGNPMYDAQTAVLMREHGVRRIYTRDTDFHRFPFLEPVDPIVRQV